MILWFNWSMFLWMYPVSKWLAVCSSGGKNMGWIIWQNLEVIKVNISFDNKRNLVKPMKNSKIHLIVQSIWLQYRKIRLLTPERFGQNETFTAWKVERKDESREKHINCVIPAQSSLGLSGWLWRTSGWCDVRIWGRPPQLLILSRTLATHDEANIGDVSSSQTGNVFFKHNIGRSPWQQIQR